MGKVFVSALSAWAPGIETANDWEEWAKGKKQITVSTSAPSLKDFTTSLFRRRISQISRMTIQVVHDTLEIAKNSRILSCEADSALCPSNIPLVFVSNRGELSREMQISLMLVREHEVLPASFGLSVFNTPIALASIALGLHGGYTAVYPAEDSFKAAFTMAAARLTSGRCSGILLVYADEMVSAQYSSLPDAVNTDGKPLEPLAFAFIITGEDLSAGLEVQTDEVPLISKDFLRHIILSGGNAARAIRAKDKSNFLVANSSNASASEAKI